MKNARYQCIIFDCDGTLVDTLDDIALCMNNALAHFGYPAAERSSYRFMVGWGIFRLAELAMPEAARTEENIQSLGEYAKNLMGDLPPERSSSKPYPGIPELLSKLNDLRPKKLKTAVISNKPDTALQNLMAGLFGPSAFDAVYGMRPEFSPKPDPSMVWDFLAEIGCSPHNAIFAGDSEIDIETARNAGCYPLGVSWGFRSRETLEKAGAARIIDSPEEILDLL